MTNELLHHTMPKSKITVLCNVHFIQCRAYITMYVMPLVHVQPENLLPSVHAANTWSNNIFGRSSLDSSRCSILKYVQASIVCIELYILLCPTDSMVYANLFGHFDKIW